MSALSELDEYISKNEPAVSFSHGVRSTFEQRPVQQQESFHHSALLNDVDGLLESLAARRNRKARELRNLQRLVELDDVTDGDDLTARSFSMTLSPTLSSPRRDREESRDSLDLKPYLTRHADHTQSPPRRYRKPGQSKLHRSREYAELRASVDEHLPDRRAAWITHPAPASAAASPPRTTAATAAATHADERHGADGQSFAAFERYLDTQAHMLRELTNSITALQQNLSARGADASVSAAAAASAGGARSADRSASISGSIVNDQEELSGWELRQQPPQLSSSFHKQSPSVSFALPATHHSSRAAANTSYSANGGSGDTSYSSHRGWKSSHQSSHLPAPGQSRYHARTSVTESRITSGSSAGTYLSSAYPESRVHARAPLSAFSTSQPDNVNSIAISSRRPVRRRHQLSESVLDMQIYSMAPPSLRSLSRQPYAQPVAQRPIATTTTTTATMVDTEWRPAVQFSRPQTPTTEPQFGGTPSPDSVEPAAAAKRTDFQAETLHDRYTSSAEQSASQGSARSSSISSRSSSSERRRAFIQVHSSPEQVPLRPAPRPAVVDQSIQGKAEPEFLRTSIATTGVQTSASVASSSSSATFQASHVSEPSTMTAARSQPDDSSVGTITSRSSVSVHSRSDPQHSSLSASSARTEFARPQQHVQETPAAVQSSSRVERSSASQAHVQQQQQPRQPPPPPARPPITPPRPSTQMDQVNQPSALPETSLDPPRRTGIQAPKITHISARTEHPMNHQYGAVPSIKYSEHVQYDELPPFEERRARFEQPVLRPATSPQYQKQTTESRVEHQRTAHFADVASLEESIMSDDSTDAPPESVTRWKTQHEELLKDMQKLSEDIDSVLRGRPPRPNGTATTRATQPFRPSSTAPPEETGRYMPGPLPLWATSPVRPRNDDDGDHVSTASRDSLNEATGVIGELLKSAPRHL